MSGGDIDLVARHLAFWVERFSDPEHAEYFDGDHYSAEAWRSLFTESERAEWRTKATRLLAIIPRPAQETDRAAVEGHTP